MTLYLPRSIDQHQTPNRSESVWSLNPSLPKGIVFLNWMIYLHIWPFNHSERGRTHIRTNAHTYSHTDRAQAKSSLISSGPGSFHRAYIIYVALEQHPLDCGGGCGFSCPSSVDKFRASPKVLPNCRWCEDRTKVNMCFTSFPRAEKKAKSACVCDKNSIFSEEQAENHHNHQLVSDGAILFSFFSFSWGENWQTRKMGRKKLNTLSIQHFCVVLFGEGAVFLRSMESRRKGRRRRCIQSWYFFYIFLVRRSATWLRNGQKMSLNDQEVHWWKKWRSTPS